MGSLAQEDKFMYVVDTTAGYSESSKGTDFGLLRLMTPGKVPTVKEVKDVEVKDCWAITVHKDIIADLYTTLNKKRS